MRASGIMAAILLAFLLAAPAFAQGTGSITGIVTAANNVAVPNATVTLWSIESGTPAFAPIPGNPQYTSDFSSSLPGLYAFTNVPPGIYNVTAQWKEYWYYTTVNLTVGTATANVVIPQYIDVMAFASPTPEPTPKTFYTYVPLKIFSPLPRATTRSPGFEALIMLLAISLAALILKRRRL